MSSSAVTTKTSKYTYRSSGGGTADVSIEYSADLSALSRLEDKIRLLQEDLESERGLRQRIEREKADLSVQVIQLSERLEEAEGGVEGQLDINRKRDAELAKLRKLLEDVHLESEETAHILKRKHQEIVNDFNEQIETLTKSRQRVEKEKSKLQAEIYELLSQVESVSKDKHISIKTIEKLEVQVTELNIRIEELNRTIVDISSHKTRLSQENIDLIKSVQDLKLSVESISYSKTQLNSQLEEARRRLEEDDRRRSMLESSLHQVETELESIRLQLEEESEARLDLERQLVKANGEAGTFKSKYEAECMARVEEVEEIRRKYTVRITETEEHIESLQARLSKLEKEKSRLQSEVEVLIIDLERANNGIREYTKRIEVLERTNIEIKTRLEETIALYDQSQRDLRQKTTDFQRLSQELDKTREQNSQLGRDNNKLQNDLHESRSTVTELTRRLHEYEVELRRLENEREELTAAYKEAEAGRKAEEKRAQALSAEYGQFRHDTERRLLEKDEEIESIRSPGTEMAPLFALDNRCERRERLIPTHVYQGNYGHAMHYYQPMIDFLDVKSASSADGRESPLPDPRCPYLPYTEERGLNRYHTGYFHFRPYSNGEVVRLSELAVATAERYRPDYRFDIKRSVLSLTATADAARLKKHVPADSVIERYQRKVAERNAQDTLNERRTRMALQKRTQFYGDLKSGDELSPQLKKAIKGKSADQIKNILLNESRRTRESEERSQSQLSSRYTTSVSRQQVGSRANSEVRYIVKRTTSTVDLGQAAEEASSQYKAVHTSVDNVRREIKNFASKTQEFLHDTSKQTSIEIEHLNARVVEAETKLKSEVQRIKKKLQIQITELEMSLDVANHTNIELQKTIKKQSLQLTELQAHYEEIQRQLHTTVDQYGIAQRRIQSLTGELEEIRVNYDSSLRAKRQVEVSLEEATTRINELSVVNANYASLKSKLENELQTLVVDYEEVSRELRVSDERYQKIQVELKHTVELLHEEQERIVKIEAIKKSLEVEVKQLSVRLEEVEVNAVAGSRRIINKLEARLRDIETELDEERRKHSETIKILRKKERSVKEVYIQIEEDQKNIQILQDALEKANQKIAAYKRQLTEQEQSSQQSVTKVRRFQRELEAAEDRADVAESNLTLVRAKHRTFVTTSSVPGSQVYLVQETTRTINESS
uniref:Myosin tail domain-containing protein n=2 Tax=Anopheles atroparvus TaxID=41427 RepID=A0A182IVX2_ANOAO